MRIEIKIEMSSIQRKRMMLEVPKRFEGKRWGKLESSTLRGGNLPTGLVESRKLFMDFMEN